MTDAEIIEALGGTFAVARICKVQGPSVSEWKRKGIPPARRQLLALLYPNVVRDEPVQSPTTPTKPDPRREAA
jgi:hypothetical protein